MKLVKDKKYKVTFLNGNSLVLTYTGTYESYFTCHVCDKQRKVTHEFSRFWREYLESNGKIDGEFYHYGSECINKLKIEPI